jgi:GNAT superfamily N-acetyltransferase
MGLRPLTGGDVTDLERFVRIAAFPPYRPAPPASDALREKVDKWLGDWKDELGIGCQEDGQLTGAAWARWTDLAVRHQRTGDLLPEVLIGVIPERRGLQLGTELMEGLKQLAIQREIYPDVVDGVEEEGGVPSRLIEDRCRCEDRQEGTPWKMFACSPLGRLMKDASVLMTSLGRARVA